MMIQWFEDRILASIPTTEENLERFSKYAKIYNEYGEISSALACALCRLVTETRFIGSSVYGAVQAYTSDNKVYHLPNLPLVKREYDSLDDFMSSYDAPLYSKSLRGIGHDLCAIFPLAKRLQVDPDQLLLVALVAAELLMSRKDEDMIVPVEIDLEAVRGMFSSRKGEKK